VASEAPRSAAAVTGGSGVAVKLPAKSASTKKRCDTVYHSVPALDLVSAHRRSEPLGEDDE